MHPRTRKAFVEELEAIYQDGLEKEAFADEVKAALKVGAKGLGKVVKKAKTVQQKIEDAGRNAIIHGYVKGGKHVRKAIELSEDLVNMGPPNPSKRHL